MKKHHKTTTQLVILVLAMITIPTLLPSGAAAAQQEEDYICSLYGDRLPENSSLCKHPMPELRFRHEYDTVKRPNLLLGMILGAGTKMLFALGGFAIWHYFRRKWTGPAQSQGA